MLSHRYLSGAIGIGLIGLTSAAALAAAAPGPNPGDEVSFCGKVVKTVECVAVMSGTQVYNINGIGPMPPIGSTISGKGYVGGEISFCMNGGINLRSAMWKKARFCHLRK